jgi:hypothetical protein
LTPPVPARLAIVSLAPNFNIPGDVTVTATVSAIAEPPFNVSVPPVTVVVPVCVFTPPNVNSPVPAFVKLPLPLTTPFQFTALATVTVAFAVIAPAPPNVSAPLFVPSPNVTFAPIENPFPSVRAVAESLDTTTPAVLNVNVPVPSAVSWPTRSVPDVNVTPPVNVFAPLNVKIDEPAFVSTNAPPPTTPLKTTALGVVTVVFDVNVPVPLSVKLPFKVPLASPSVTAPPTEYTFASVRAVVESLESAVPVAIVNEPVPKPALFPTRTVPAVTDTPPVNVFAPPNVSTEAPAFVNENAPPTAPLKTTPLGVVTVVFDVSVPLPPIVKTPVFAASPSVTDPPRE